MAKKDRVLTLEDLLSGNFSEEYLDKKERIAVIKRHINRLAERRYDLDDKIEFCGEREDWVAERNKITAKIEKLQRELHELEEA